MNTRSNAMSEATLESQVSAPAVISPARRFYWSVRREVWENRSIYLRSEERRVGKECRL